MAKVAEYAPRIRSILERQSNGRGISVHELADQVGCSTQQVYKVLQQLGTKKKIIGQTPTGAYLYSYDPKGEEAPKGYERKVGTVPAKGQPHGKGQRGQRGRRALLQINDLVTIKGVRSRPDGKVEVELEDEAGERVKAVLENGTT